MASALRCDARRRLLDLLEVDKKGNRDIEGGLRQAHCCRRALGVGENLSSG